MSCLRPGYTYSLQKMVDALRSFPIQIYHEIASFLEKNPSFCSRFDEFFCMNAFCLIQMGQYSMRQDDTLEVYRENVKFQVENREMAEAIAVQKIRSITSTNDYGQLLAISANEGAGGLSKLSHFFEEQKAEADADADAEAEAEVADSGEVTQQFREKKLKSFVAFHGIIPPKSTKLVRFIIPAVDAVKPKPCD
jgi:hypothetical protein